MSRARSPRLAGIILAAVAQVVGYAALVAVLLGLYFGMGPMVRGWLS